MAGAGGEPIYHVGPIVVSEPQEEVSSVFVVWGGYCVTHDGRVGNGCYTGKSWVIHTEEFASIHSLIDSFGDNWRAYVSLRNHLVVS